MPTLRPEIAVIGAGLMGRWHAAAAHRLGARVVAVVDPDPARAGALARRYGAQAWSSLEALPVPGHQPVAHVCTPAPSHRDTCQRLLAAGWHVLCEKPLADSVAEVEQLLQIADRNGRYLCAVHQFTSQRGVTAVQARLASVANLTQISFRICTAGAAGFAPTQSDDVVRDVLPHPLSILRVWLPGATLAGAPWHVDYPRAGELQVAARIAGVPITIHVSCASRPTEATAEVRGPDGTAHVDFFHGHASFSGPAVSRSRKILQPFTRPARQAFAAGVNLSRRVLEREPAYPGLRQLTHRVYDFVAGQGAAPMTADDLLEVYGARDRIAAAMQAIQ